MVKSRANPKGENTAPPGMIEMDHHFMGIALEQAKLASLENEVPVGAVVVSSGVVVAKGRNAKESEQDPTAHAEMAAIRQACAKLKRWRLNDCTLYTTMEPCPMCAGAMLSARIERLVFGCSDPKAGVAGSLYNLVDDSRLNHRIQVTGGVLYQDAAQVLQVFFKGQREKSKVPRFDGV